ncbi:hypothetical protein ABE501_18210 [Comamonas testosteroni]
MTTRVDETQIARLEGKHVKDSLYNANRLAAFKFGIDGDVCAELLRAERLHRDTDSRAAICRAQVKADITASHDLVDQASALDASLARDRVVATGIRGVLQQRDVEVAELCDQVKTERSLNCDAGDQASEMGKNNDLQHACASLLDCTSYQ